MKNEERKAILIDAQSVEFFSVLCSVLNNRSRGIEFYSIKKATVSDCLLTFR